MATGVTFSEFNGEVDNWQMYSERLTEYFKANDVGEDKQVAKLLSILSPSTYKLLRDLCFPDLPNKKTFKQLSELLAGHYGHKPVVWHERSMFQDAKQEPGETISQWYARICSLAVDCKYQEEGELKNKLKEKFVTGMIRGRIFNRICEEDATITLEKLVEIAKNKENILSEEGEVKVIRKFQRRGQQFERKERENGADQHGAASKRQDSRPSASSSSRGQLARGRRRRSIEGFTVTDDNTKVCKQCKSCNRKHDGECFYKQLRCHICKQKGHLARACRKKKVNFIEKETSDRVETDDRDIWHLVSVPNIVVDSKILMCCNKSSARGNRFVVAIEIDNKNFSMEIDTGASISAVNQNFYQKHFRKYTLKKDSLMLRSYNNSVFKPEGYFVVRVRYGDEEKLIKFYVVEDGAASILGRNWLDAFNVGFSMVNRLSVESRVDEVVKRFPEVFSNKIGCFRQAKISLHLKENVTPIFCKPRPIPLAYRTRMDEELTRLEEEGIITPISTSEWATPLVPVLKNDGTVRICADYKVTVNKYLRDMHYPLPRIEEIFSKLHKGQYFTKLDLESAYRQFEMEENAAEVLTWSTHRGLYQVNRLPFGVTIASFVFQKHMEQLFRGMDNVITYLDDILLTGKTDTEHIETLEKVLEILRKAGLTLKLVKCEFFKEEIEYLGHRITRQGLAKSEKKVQAIKEAHRPTSVTEVRSFLGMVNYYNKFIPKAAHILKPMYSLLKGDVEFKWTQECERAFKEIKEILSSDSVLVHYDPELPVILITDASAVGIAAVLAHQMPGGEERPICYTSRTLMPAENNYPTIQKEGLAIYYGVSKFYQYLYGRRFIIRTDHRPLVALFSENKGIPLMYANRLQRWATYLSSFNYEIQYIKGKDNVVADYFSRAPLKVNTESEEFTGKGEYINFTSRVEEWPIDNDEIREQTRQDEELQEVMKYVKAGKWPEEKKENIRPYYNRRHELEVHNGILMWGYRIVVPKSLRKKVLEELHSHHWGMVKTKSLARSYVYWPDVDGAVEDICRSCIYCLENRPLPPRTPLTPWKIESKPWSRVHMDYLGPLKGKMFLLMIDAYSKWMEVYMVNNMTSMETEEKIKDACSRWGMPRVVVTDNATQFLAENVQIFFRRNGIKHITAPVANPASNGSAENAVKTFKTNMKTRLGDPKNKGKSLKMIVMEFLFSYRTTAHCTTNETPAKLFLNRPVRTRLDLLRETRDEDENIEETYTPAQRHQQKVQDRQVKNYGGRRRRFEVGEKVMVTDYRTVNQRKWTPAEVIMKKGRNTYLCRIEEGKIWKRHTNQIIRRGTVEKGDTEIRITNRKTGVRSYATGAKQARTEEQRTLETRRNPEGTVDSPEESNVGQQDAATGEPETSVLEASAVEADKQERIQQDSRREELNDQGTQVHGNNTLEVTEATQTNSNKDVTPSAERVKVGKDCHSLGRTQEKCRPSRQVKVPRRFTDFVMDFE